MRILVIHGANLRRLGFREKKEYGEKTLNEINDEIMRFSKKNGIEVEIFQSNSEGEIIDKIETSADDRDGIIINPGAYTHYSYAIRDAIKAIGLPTIEVHMTNIYGREDFRKNSVIVPVCCGQICGFREKSYILALKIFLMD